jgi:hypothetical protein
MKRSLSSEIMKFLSVSLISTAAWAIPPGHGGNGFPPPEPVRRIQGTLTVDGCQTAMGDVSVTVNGVRRAPNNVISSGNNIQKYGFTMLVREDDDGPWTIRPAVSPSKCPRVTYSAPSVVINNPYTGRFAFTAAASGSMRRHISLQRVLPQLNTLLQSARLRLHNYHSQQSFVQLAGVQLGIQINPAVVDIDCGTLCPDLGDALFYLNQIDLTSASMQQVGTSLRMSMGFEDGAREIKGIHSSLGDDGVPDFDMRQISLLIDGRVVVNQGGLSLYFSNPKFNAQIDSTGGCHIAGIDLCNKIFGTDRKIQTGVEASAMSALNSAAVQAGLKLAFQRMLQSEGVNGTIVRATIVGTDLVVEYN